MLIETDIRLDAAIGQTMQYFALFRYPLYVEEIRQYCGIACSEDEVQAFLNEEELHGSVFSTNGCYSLLSDVAGLLERRLKGKEKAIRDIKVARKVGRLIYQMPFVSFVGISGSLSKGYSDSKSDFDFFIVTQKDRLWIARTLLHLMKKLSFLAGQQHKLCMNYFIDESALCLQEKNIYTATELSSLVPVCGSEVYQQLMQANRWRSTFLPNYGRKVAEAVTDNVWIIKPVLGGIFNSIHPSGLNRFLMKLTDSKWRKKWAKKRYPAEDYELAFKTRINISKNHHLNYQKRVLSALSPADN